MTTSVGAQIEHGNADVTTKFSRMGNNSSIVAVPDVP